MKKLSVITICYNIKDEIERTCESIVNQTWQDFEWIIVDGGSTDGTLDILNKYKDRVNIFISEKDKGVYNAMNKGIRLAHGKWLNFMNGGDTFYEKDVLEKVFKGKDYGADVLYGQCCVHNLDQSTPILTYPEKLDLYFFCSKGLNHQSSFIKKELFKKYGLYDENYKISSDKEKYLLFISKKCLFLYLPFPIANFYRGGISGNFATNPQHQMEYTKTLQKYYNIHHKMSVIIPVFNMEKYLKTCLDSVLDQTLKDIEVICVDDGSTDNSLKLLEQYAKQDDRVIVLKQNHKKQGAARNKAMEIATGEYIDFLDADDYLDKQALELLYNEARKRLLDMLSFDANNFQDGTNKMEPYPYTPFKTIPDNLKKNSFNWRSAGTFLPKLRVSACLTIYRNIFLKQYQIQFPENLYFEDNYFFTKSICLASRCAILDKVLYFRRIHPNSTIQNHSNHIMDYIQIADLCIQELKKMNMPQWVIDLYITFHSDCLWWSYRKSKKRIWVKWRIKKLIRSWKNEVNIKIALPIFGYRKKQGNLKIKIFGLPIVCVKRKLGKPIKRLFILGIPLLKIKKNQSRTIKKVYLLGIPIWIQHKKSPS